MKKIILTFDDGPSKDFGNLLDYLIKNNHKAIFFICGQEVNKNNENLLIKAIKNGFLIGNHSYSHPYFSRISFEKAKEEILKTETVIDRLYKKANKIRPIKIFRFPFFDFGLLNKLKLQRFLKSQEFENPYYQNYSLVSKIYRGKYDLFCTLNPKDWSTKTTPEKAISRIKNAKDGDIIDLHDQAYSFNHLTKPVCEHLASKGFILGF